MSVVLRLSLGKILFARALLYLDQGQIDKAMAAFQAIRPSSLLVDFCVANPKLLSPDGGHPTDDHTAETSQACLGFD